MDSISQIQDLSVWSVSKDDLSVFPKVSQKLTVADDLILEGNKVVLPKNLCLKVLDLAHAPGHIGLTKVKMLLRETVSFPYIDKQAKEIIDKCLLCHAASRGKPPAPLRPSEFPPSAWYTLKADFLGLVLGTRQPQYPLVTVDCYS